MLIRGILTGVMLAMTAPLLASIGGSTPPVRASEIAYPEGTYAEVPGARLYYIDTGGNGVPVVLLHAATGSSQTWEYQLPAFTAAGYRVIAYDRRGWGRTEIAPESGPQPGSAADDLAALMDVLGIDRFHVIGTAAGGIAAVDFALSWPERLRTLVVANSIYGIQDPAYVELGARLRPQPQFNQLPADFRELGPSYRAANPEGTRRWLELEGISRPPGPLAPAQVARNRVTFAVLETISLPTLLIAGDADLYTPPSVQRLVNQRLKGAESITIPEVGHSAYWEQPEQFNRAVLEFLQRADLAQ
jgi:pimeloyl-ACP methyl ester carboxylesterase